MSVLLPIYTTIRLQRTGEPPELPFAKVTPVF